MASAAREGRTFPIDRLKITERANLGALVEGKPVLTGINAGGSPTLDLACGKFGDCVQVGGARLHRGHLARPRLGLGQHPSGGLSRL